jgi:thiol-disulfide isomerase/thioredoxin
MANNAETGDAARSKALEGKPEQSPADGTAAAFAGIHQELSSRPVKVADAGSAAKAVEAAAIGAAGAEKSAATAQSPEDIAAAKQRSDFQKEVEIGVRKENQFGPIKPGQNYEDAAREFGHQLAASGEIPRDFNDADVKRIGASFKDYNGGKDAPTAGEMIFTASSDRIKAEIDGVMQRYDKDVADRKQIQQLYKDDPEASKARNEFRQSEIARIQSETLESRLGPVKAGQSYEDLVREQKTKTGADWSESDIKDIVANMKSVNGKDAPSTGDMVLTRGAAAERKEFTKAMDTYDKDLLEFHRPAVDIADRFETRDIAKAFQMAKEQHLPLVVQFGAYWCPHCQKMTKEVMPQFEGSAAQDGQAGKPGALQGKAIFLHLDAQADRFLTGDAAAKAKIIEKGAQDKNGDIGFPTYMVFSPDDQSKPVQFKQGGETVQNRAGEMTAAQLVAFLKSAGMSKQLTEAKLLH